MDFTTLAANQLSNRPKDETFSSMADYLAAARHDKDFSKSIVYNAKDLRVVPDAVVRAAVSQPTLALQSPRGKAQLTSWSGNQLARSVGAPWGYVSTLPTDIASQALNFGLQHTAMRTDLNLLVRANGSAPIVRAATSTTYGRLWDANLAAALQDTLFSTGEWMDGIPTWEGPKAGLYRGDRDSFIISVNGGSIVNDPSVGSNGQMFRGIIVRNSEVGACGVKIYTFLLRYICGNHLLHGVEDISTYSRRHVGVNVERDVVRRILTIAQKWTQASASRDEAIIKSLIEHDIAATREGVVDELRALGFTKEAAEAAYTTAEAREVASPRSFWGLVNGVTRNSQAETHQDERLSLDQLAAKIYALGVKRHAVTV